MPRTALAAIMGLAGAAVGAVLAFFVVYWLYNQNLYALMLPGAAMGLGVHLASPYRSNTRGIIVGVAALIAGILTDHHFFPFRADGSLGYYVTNLPRVVPAHLLMMALGAAFGYWWGKLSSPWIDWEKPPTSSQR